MPRVQQPGLQPTHKLVQAYYAALAQFDRHHVTRETAVRQRFLNLLRAAAGQCGWSLEPEFPMQGSRDHCIVMGAALRDAFWRVHGYWETLLAKHLRGLPRALTEQQIQQIAFQVEQEGHAPASAIWRAIR